MKIYRALSLLMIPILTFGSTNVIQAANSTNLEEYVEITDNNNHVIVFNADMQTNYDDAIQELEKMTNEEMNQYIENVMIQYSSSNTYLMNDETSVNRIGSVDPIQTAWLAAAKIIENKGYTCTARLIQDSVSGTNYVENDPFGANGLFSKKIVSTSPYKNYLSKLKNNKKLPKGLEFKKSDNADLFYSLHNVDITSRANMPGTAYATYNFTITDTYDFKYEDYNDLFTSLVNNWAWLSQNISSLHKIRVTIMFLQ